MIWIKKTKKCAGRTGSGAGSDQAGRRPAIQVREVPVAPRLRGNFERNVAVGFVIVAAPLLPPFPPVNIPATHSLTKLFTGG